MKTWLQRLFDVRRDEVLPVCLAVLFFFCVLVALMILRPAREALGLRGGIDAVRWLFMGTALAALLVNPLFGWLVSRLPRLQFITATYAFFACSLVGFHLLLVLTPEAVGVVSGQVFYVWFSVFNLFATMVFWALMADRFTLEQGKRFFGLIAVGGTLGAIAGPWLAARLAAPLGTPALLLVSAGFLTAGLAAAWGIARVGAPRSAPLAAATGRGAALPGEGVRGEEVRGERALADDARAPIGGSAWAGVRAVFASRYLLGMAAYVVILAVMATFLYFTRLQMVAELGDDLDLRTTMFARIDLITQLATLLLQALVAGRLMQRVGVPLTLALLPLTTALGFVGLALVGSLAALVAFEAAFRAVQRALMRPARETLFTVLPREDKYKAKAFIDTFVYRGGDVIGAQLEGLLGRLGMGLAALASVALPLALLWAALALWLGRTQQRMAAAAAAAAAPARAAQDAPRHDPHGQVR
ncbi:MAG TPA: MFS transporter [Thauera sp.]|nr:MFS transporter [Thauera sp.]HHW65123.1 MFS transporter [Rhodocyclaceae bacterium]